jgi:pimeloyl-ACP methyl ester carboxylesterase
VQAQGPNPKPPINGVHYRFERMVAERPVDDAHDKGTIRLVSYVYRPLQNDRGEVVVSLHGSAGGLVIAPEEPFLGPGPPLWFLLQRGMTVVIPMRRGRAESSGRYVEECPYQTGKCSLGEYRELTSNGLADALASTEAVINQVVLPRLKPPNGRILLWGPSRGGVLALHYAAKFPDRVRAVVAVSPGWLSIVDKWPADENGKRLGLQKAIFASAGKAYRGPTLWVYADTDPFYAEPVTRELFAAFEKAGGRGKYVQVREPTLTNGHVPPVELWQQHAEQFLSELAD